MRSRLAKVETPKQRATNEEDIRRLIAEAAYYRAEKRGFTPGAEEQDWCEAEREVRASLGTPPGRL